MTTSDRTTPDRVIYWRGNNARFGRFVRRAEQYGWTLEPSSAAIDCILVRHPSRRDHFVLYPRGIGRTSSLTVYDGRDGYEFSPIPAREALAYIAEVTA